MAHASDQPRRFSKPKEQIIPPIVARSLGILLLTILGFVAWAQLTERPKTGQVPQSPIAAERAFILETELSGTVIVRDESGALLTELNLSNGGGFISTIDRALARERMKAGVPADAPITLIKRENGRISLSDTGSGWSVDLMGFGKDNVRAFASLLEL